MKRAFILANITAILLLTSGCGSEGVNEADAGSSAPSEEVNNTLNVVVSSNTEMETNDVGSVLSSSSFDTLSLYHDTIHIAAAESVAMYSENVTKARKAEIAELKEVALSYGDDMKYNEYRSDSSTVVMRADDAIISVIEIDTLVDDNSGEEKVTYLCYACDSATGADLYFEDVFVKPKKLATPIKNALYYSYGDIEYTVDIESYINERLESGELVWALGGDAIHFYFSPGEIADKSLDALHISLSYEDYNDLLNASYRW